MSKSIERRLAAAERRIKPRHTDFTIIRLIGGLPVPVRWAEGGGLRWTRPIDEPLDAFEARVISDARAAGAKFVAIGGLPPNWLPEGFVSRNPEDYDYPEAPPEEVR
jgi:hypothetical protein